MGTPTRDPVQFLQAWSTLALSQVSLKEIRGLVGREQEEQEAAQSALRQRVLDLEGRWGVRGGSGRALG